MDQRADRILDLVQMGELSSALTPLRVGISKRWMRCQIHRVASQFREVLPGSIINHVPQLEIEQEARQAHKVVSESERDLHCGSRVKSLQGITPAKILQAVTMGRMTALQKPQGGIRDIVVGDFIRRVARAPSHSSWGSRASHCVLLACPDTSDAEMETEEKRQTPDDREEKQKVVQGLPSEQVAITMRTGIRRCQHQRVDQNIENHTKGR